MDIKKAGINFWLVAVSAVLTLIGAICFIVTGAGSYKIEMGGMGIAFAIIAVLALLGAVYLTISNGNSLIIAVLTLVALALSMVCVGLLILNRADLAAALFTWDPNNGPGWMSFIQSAISMGAFIISSIVLIVNAFIGKSEE